MTPPEVLAYRPGGGAANTPGWDLRVVPNKYPALQVEGTLDREGEGMFDRMSGIGAHEVIIETPDHDRPLALQSETEIERVLWACRERMLDLKRDFRLQVHPGVQEPRRRGRRDAGASARAADRAADRARLRARRDRRRAAALRASRSAASSATSSRRSGATSGGVIQENADMIAIAPYAPRFAFETWLLPQAARRAVRGGAAGTSTRAWRGC